MSWHLQFYSRRRCSAGNYSRGKTDWESVDMDSTTLIIIPYHFNYTVSKTSPYYFLNNSVKNQPIWIICGKQNQEQISRKLLRIWPPNLRNVIAVPCEIQNSGIWRKLWCFPQNVNSSTIASCFVTWQLKFQTSNIAQVVKNVNLLWYVSSYFYHQSTALSTLIDWLIDRQLCWNSAHFEFAESAWMVCVHGRRLVLCCTSCLPLSRIPCLKKRRTHGLL